VGGAPVGRRRVNGDEDEGIGSTGFIYIREIEQ
jgi:hypothetical protein